VTDEDAIARAVRAMIARVPQGDVSLDVVEAELSRALGDPIGYDDVDAAITLLEREGRTTGGLDVPLGRDKLVAVGRAAVELKRETGRTPAIEAIAERAGCTRSEALRGLVVVRFVGRTGK
jgi:hypothetical protein